MRPAHPGREMRLLLQLSSSLASVAEISEQSEPFSGRVSSKEVDLCFRDTALLCLTKLTFLAEIRQSGRVPLSFDRPPKTPFSPASPHKVKPSTLARKCRVPPGRGVDSKTSRLLQGYSSKTAIKVVKSCSEDDIYVCVPKAYTINSQGERLGARGLG